MRAGAGRRAEILLPPRVILATLPMMPSALVCALVAAAVLGTAAVPGVWVGRAEADVPAVTLGDCTHHVTPDGDDASPGTRARPWRHVDFAVDQVGAGDVVCVGGGTYRELVTFDRSGRASGEWITLAADPAATSPVILDGTIDGVTIPNRCVCPATIQIEGRSHVRVSGIVVENRGNARYLECRGALPEQCSAKGIGVQTVAAGSVVTDVVIDRCTLRDIAPIYPQALGIPLSVGAQARGSVIRELQVHGNRFLDSDTAGPVIETGMIGLTGSVRDFAITGNVFDDASSIGIDLGGNQLGDDYPLRGVISDNQFLTRGASANYAVQIQGGQQMLVERNYFQHAGRGVAVTTEPPCDVDPHVLAKHVWIRSNVFSGTQHQDLVTGAFDNASASDCPGAPFPRYLGTESVWFTNNTVVRPTASGDPTVASISVVGYGDVGLGGDSRVMNNVFVAGDRVFDVQVPAGAPAPRFEFNTIVYLGVAAAITPFRRNGLDLTWPGWQQAFDGSSGFTTGSGLFAGARARADFRLPAGSPLVDAATPVPGTRDPQAWPTRLGPSAFGPFTPAVELDVYGVPRHRGAAPDRGAGEL